MDQKRTKKAKNNYVDNKQLYTELVKWLNKREVQEQKGEELSPVPEYIGKCILLIAQNLANKPNFSGYSWKDEMIFDGIENCIRYMHKFNHNKYTNAHAYITKIVWQAFVRRIQKEKKEQYTKYKIMQQSSILYDISEQSKYDDTYVTINVNDDKSNEIIKNFEDSLEKKKLAEKNDE